MNNVMNRIEKTGIIPVVVIDRAKDAVPLVKSLMEGGLNCAEVTFRTEAAADAIKTISDEYPDMLVGAGTVLTTAQVDKAYEAGASFIVSPGLNPKTVKYCLDKNIPVIPGVNNASDIERGLELGLDVLKFFPAEQSGGLKMIKALAAAYVNVRFMPTGGLNEKNVRDYLSYDKVFACGGSWMVKKDLILSGDFKTITALSKEASNIVKELRG